MRPLGLLGSLFLGGMVATAGFAEVQKLRSWTQVGEGEAGDGGFKSVLDSASETALWRLVARQALIREVAAELLCRAASPIAMYV